MSNEMKHRIALAILNNPHTGDYVSALERTVEAVLDALREPTPAMDAAGERHCERTDAWVVWQAMIDAAKAGA